MHRLVNMYTYVWIPKGQMFFFLILMSLIRGQSNDDVEQREQYQRMDGNEPVRRS